MNVPQMFGENVFNDAVQKETLPKEVYKALRATIESGKQLDVSIAGSVAAAMKDWAVSKGATHYTHWFQPLTGLTAEKHDSFIEPDGDKVIMRLTGKSLIVGEPDASSFPSGGSRATFMARGYTAWDPTSPAFVKEGTLYIPTVFVSYTGETLDKKSPLLRSMNAIDKQAKRILSLFGITCKKVSTTVGPEQEYFLISEEMYEKRKDLRLCGRTLIGAPVSRGQELEDHYFGVLKPKIAEFMADLDKELWSYGIPSKTKHNEVAPAQHEMAPVFSTTNKAVDMNMLTMEIMRKVANKHGLICLLHEKPFEGINGSGKHNNWSMSTDAGFNLLDPGKEPENNTLFKLVLAAVIKAVDDYQGILRASVASAGNDHRLGANEAPPAIISVYLGDQLGALVDSIVKGEDYVPKKALEGSIGVPESPIFPKDATDRNRTSPFAFTGNKFEFRMLGSQANVSDPNIVLNTVVADAFEQFADELEGANDLESAANAIVERELKAHYRIIFNLDGYGPEWEPEAMRRGLLNNKNTADAVPVCFEDKNIQVFVKQGVYTKAEAVARANIQLENYTKIINIEALTLLEMAKQDIIPAVSDYVAELCANVAAKQAVNDSIPCNTERDLIMRLAEGNDKLSALIIRLEDILGDIDMEEGVPASQAMAHEVIPVMEEMRHIIDGMEKITSSEYWPYPTYFDLLYSVK
ncbi:MAG TPA: glutamine synthetase III [Candidatus Coproplasma avicola]|uniref:Glutamine synthetase III n=1 Tax=Candidatus Coproplasma avicola TaxID=2840744 RepID=A0A9D1E5X8_9FIRM|nr:glutamine synthetase III [Candidatus Coproplasma avicola]